MLNPDSNTNHITPVVTPTSVTPTDPAAALLQAKLQYALEKSLLELDNVRWKARRRMAWLSLISILVFTAVVLIGMMIWKVPLPNESAIGSIITWFYISATSVIAAFVGASAFTYIASLRHAADWRGSGGDRDDRRYDRDNDTPMARFVPVDPTATSAALDKLDKMFELYSIQHHKPDSADH